MEGTPCEDSPDALLYPWPRAVVADDRRRRRRDAAGNGESGGVHGSTGIDEPSAGSDEAARRRLESDSADECPPAAERSSNAVSTQESAPDTNAGPSDVEAAAADVELETVAQSVAAVGEPDVEDTAFISAPTVTGPPLTGSVTFNLYGPDDVDCTGAIVFTSTNAITKQAAPGEAIVDSSPATLNQAGVYRWVASYSGDANYNPVTAPCNAPEESTYIYRAERLAHHADRHLRGCRRSVKLRTTTPSSSSRRRTVRRRPAPWTSRCTDRTMPTAVRRPSSRPWIGRSPRRWTRPTRRTSR